MLLLVCAANHIKMTLDQINHLIMSIRRQHSFQQ